MPDLVDADMIAEAPLREIAARAAEEGIPVAAIGRILAKPYNQVTATIHHYIKVALVIEMPRADWPAGVSRNKRHPQFPAELSYDDLMFQCQTSFKLTKLEAALLIALLKNERADKMKLHNVVEQQRFARHAQPAVMDESDPKMVDVMICKLRKKLKSIHGDLLIKTVWGDGYFIEPAAKEIAFAKLKGQSPTPVTAQG